MLKKKHPELKKAVDSVVKISFRQRWRWAVLDWQMYAMDKRARKRQIQLDLEKSRAEGRAEGHAKLIETARNLKSLGVSTDIISKSTGLLPEEIAKL